MYFVHRVREIKRDKKNKTQNMDENTNRSCDNTSVIHSTKKEKNSKFFSDILCTMCTYIA